MRTGLRDMVFAGVMLIVNGLFWLETRKSQYQEALEQDYGFDPAFFPRILLGLWAALCIVMIIRAVLNETRDSPAPLWHRFFIAVVLTGGYLFAMQAIGFLFASVPFAAIFMYVFGYRHRYLMPLIAVVFPLATWWVFVFPLRIPLPVSPWFIRL